jgi:L-aspartate oxidase
VDDSRHISERRFPGGFAGGAELPRRLAVPEPGWRTTADVVVVGSGIAGLTTALAARAAGRVLVVTKTVLDAGSTRWAQGGIAAALGPGDSPEQHLRDTLLAGVGVCDVAAVRTLVTEGPGRVRELIALGTQFDTTPSGDIALTREGGHRRDRIAHAGGDATGVEIERALIAALHADPQIEVVEHALAIDLLRTADGRVCGLTLHVIGEGQRDGIGAVLSKAVVVATGGIGQVYSSTTNPAVSTGDGLAMALRAGADIADLEFVQFHPTVLWLGEQASGQQPLISEAVRGEGAVLVDAAGVRFMAGEHPMADLAPRDVVAKAIMRRMTITSTPHVYLDARALGRELMERRFPTIVERCREHGIDPVTQLIPVVPACHYASGGIRTDLRGRSSIPGLYACGEASCTGVHGANRLASNSLLEGLVFGHRIAEDVVAGLPPQGDPAPPTGKDGYVSADHRSALQRTMTAGAGVVRSGTSLATTAGELRSLAVSFGEEPSTEAWETANLHTVATALVQVAALRSETRGSHWRQDFPDPSDEWRGQLISNLGDDGILTTRYRPIDDDFDNDDFDNEAR